MIAPNGMIRSRDGVFDVPNHSIDPCKFFPGNAFGAASGDNALVFAIRDCNRRETGQSIGNHHAAWDQMSLGPPRDLRQLEALNNVHSHANRVTLIITSNSGNKWRFIFRSSANLSARHFAADIGVIQLNDPCQWLAIVSLLHYLHDLVFYAPCRIVGDTNISLKSQR